MWRIKFCLALAMILNLGLVSEEVLRVNLEDCLVYGLQNHFLLAIQKEKGKLFPLVEREKWRNYLPKIGIHYFGTNSANKNQIDNEYHDLRLQMQQLLYDGGETQREIQKVKIQSLIHKEDWNLFRQEIEKQIGLHYLELSKWTILESLFDGHYLKLAGDLEKVEREFKLGYISKKEYSLVSLKWKDFEEKKIKLGISKETAKQSLYKVLSLPESVTIKILPQFIFKLQVKEIPGSKLKFNLEALPSIKKSKLSVEQAKLDEESNSEAWKPKVFMGGYVGKNTNDGLPIKNQVYGISFGLQANLGGSTVSGSSLAGVQTEGTGIQRIPGFGPQYVGRGENLFQSGSVQLFDDVSISRKNFETEWNLKTAKAQQKQITDQLNADLISKQLRTREAYEIYLIQYEKYLGFVDYFRVRELEYKNGYISFLELIKEEDEALLYLEKTLDAYVTFVSHIYELSVLSGLSPIQNDYYSFINTSIDPRWESIIQSFEPKTFEKKLENPGPKQIKETPFYMEKK